MHYAAYGSNLHILRLRQRAPSARLLGTAFIADYSLHFHKRGADGSGKCNIHASAGGIFVAIYRLDRADKPRLDAAERVGNGYVDEPIHVPGYGNCFTYHATDSHIDDALLPFDWYQQMVLLGSRWLDFPDRYLARISAVKSTRDPDAYRHRENWQIVKSLRDGGDPDGSRPPASAAKKHATP